MTEATIDCRRCNHRMDLVATIQPFRNQPGLNAYACTTCGHKDSESRRILEPARPLR
jgi:DNA-directed RNA polymerase subunit RPC12/RpoP